MEGETWVTSRWIDVLEFFPFLMSLLSIHCSGLMEELVSLSSISCARIGCTAGASFNSTNRCEDAENSKVRACVDLENSDRS